ncbi:MAG: ribonucleotide-diphosphate reductase subunit beta [Gammaproteobacteria bacterium]|nr:ribonucleotide-diphosphate reductase subunit beta [Acholeplasmataceae bacterium]MCK9528945.1 ribonucleotide-diphosphate reductase subunit beta [Gammaproteobacteria bacterium]
MSELFLPSNVFNVNKTDYERTPIIFGQKIGLFDSINKQYPKLHEYFKTQKSLDWSEDEFDYRSCLVEFEKSSKFDYDLMVKTLAWQWEGDSLASNTIMSVLDPVLTCSEGRQLYYRIVDNELLHAATYSEIVRMSFSNPSVIMNEILSVRESLQRLNTIGKVMDEAVQFSAWYAYKQLEGPVEVTQEMYNKIFMFFVALLCFERIQFMSSFAITFAYGDMGRFLPIAKAVQKIAQDEFEIHVQAAMEVIRNLILTPMGMKAFQENKEKIVILINEVHASETAWNEYVFSEGRRLDRINGKMMQSFSDFSACSVAQFFGLENEIKAPLVMENPLHYFGEWVNISKTQYSPQEEQGGQYKLNIVRRNDEKKVFEFDLNI